MTNAAEPVFIDTNILVFASWEAAPLHEAARQTLAGYRQAGAALVISRQVIREWLATLSSAAVSQKRREPWHPYRWNIGEPLTLPAGMEMVMPGDNVEMGVELIVPVALEEGLRLAIREGGHTIGSGVVTNISAPVRA